MGSERSEASRMINLLVCGGYMSSWRWYREWRGGYWYYTHSIGWQKATKEKYESKIKERLGRPAWAHECYVH